MNRVFASLTDVREHIANMRQKAEASKERYKYMTDIGKYEREKQVAVHQAKAVILDDIWKMLGEIDPVWAHRDVRVPEDVCMSCGEVPPPRPKYCEFSTDCTNGSAFTVTATDYDPIDVCTKHLSDCLAEHNGAHVMPIITEA